MARRRKHPTPEQARYVSPQDVAVALGWGVRDLRISLTKHWYLWMTYDRSRIGSARRYDAQVIDVLRGITGQQCDELAPPGASWLDKYLKGDT